MRILHYNIFEGGGDRLPTIAHIVTSCAPDIVGILEANGWMEHQSSTLHAFGDMIHCTHRDIATTASSFCLATLTPHAPTRFIHIEEGFHHAVSGLVQTVAPGKELAFVFYHANPFSEDARVEEIHRLCDLLAPFAYAVVMGDFNALSPHDDYDTRGTLSALQERGIKKFGEDRLRFDAITTFEQAGMHDVAHVRRLHFTPTAPTPGSTDAMHAVPVRLDYAFVSSSLLPFVEDIAIIKNPQTDQASDHYPVLLTLKDIQ